MADPRLKQLKIKTGIVKRITKEKVCYDKEAEGLKVRVQSMKDEGKEEIYIKKQEEVLQESLMMIPDCQRRLVKAFDELKKMLIDEQELRETDEYSLAKKVLEDAQQQLPNPDDAVPTRFYQPNYSSASIRCLSQNVSNLTAIPIVKDVNLMPTPSLSREDHKILQDLDKKYADKIDKTKFKQNYGLHAAKQSLRLAASCLGNIKSRRNNLNENSWNDILSNKNQLLSTLNKFDNNYISNLKKQIKTRQAVRRRQKNKRNKLNEVKRLQDLKRNNINKKIDYWLRKKEKEVERYKVEQDIKHEADNVLRDVSKKLSEGKKMLSLINSLSQLRGVRQQQESGSSLTVETDVFNTVINKVKEMWQKQIVTYEAEEKVLKVMLQESAIERVNILSSEFVNNLVHWEVVLFGDSAPSNEYDYYALTEGERNADRFLSIRKEWDKYLAGPSNLVTSSIPNGWVLPVSPSNNNWSKIVKKS